MEEITKVNELIDDIDEKLGKIEDYEVIINLLYKKIDLLESIIGIYRGGINKEKTI